MAWRRVRLIFRVFIGWVGGIFSGKETVSVARPVGEVLERDDAFDRWQNFDAGAGGVGSGGEAQEVFSLRETEDFEEPRLRRHRLFQRFEFCSICKG